MKAFSNLNIHAKRKYSFLPVVIAFIFSLLIFFIQLELRAEEIQGNISSSILSDTPLETDSLLLSEQNKRALELKNDPWLFLQPYHAEYSVISEGNQLGSAKRILEYTDNQWKLEISSKLSKWLLTLKSKEFSIFSIKDNHLWVKQFVSKTKVSFKKEKSIIQDFDWQLNKETGEKGERQWLLPLNEPVFDRMSHILKLRADLLRRNESFDYLVSYKGKHEQYSYVKSSFEKITTEMGEFIALKLDRKKGDDSSFSIWLSPELDYIPIKIAQFEQDKPDVTLLLNKLNYLNE